MDYFSGKLFPGGSIFLQNKQLGSVHHEKYLLDEKVYSVMGVGGGRGWPI